VDIRLYLELEVALTRRLQSYWQEYSQPTFAAIAKACDDKQWDTAIQLVQDLDLTSVGVDNKQYIKYSLLNLMAFGGTLTQAEQVQFLKTGDHEEILNLATNCFLMYLMHAGTADLQDEVLQSIAKLKADEVVQKKEYKYGNTQIDIPEGSNGAGVMESLRKQINPNHFGGEGDDVGHNHVTVRYGLTNSKHDADALREYIHTLHPFTASLGAVEIFPVSDHSDGASPVVIRVESPDLEKIHDEIAQHASFIEPTFKEYKPHATLAYVQPEYSEIYKKLDADGVQFPVNSITITHQDGSEEEVPFGVQKVESYLKPIVSFDNFGHDQLALISSLNSSRMATYGFTAEAEARNIHTYKLAAVLDGRTSKFCRFVANGRVFKVTDARSKVLQTLNVTDPNALKTIQPWPKQDKASIVEYQRMSNDELVSLGLHIGPFHPGCRTLCVDLGVETRTEKPPVPENAAIPSEQATENAFQELGVPVGADDIDQWNTYMGINPVQMFSKLTGASPLQVIDKLWHTSLKFMDNGEIVSSAEGIANDAKISISTAYDPVSGKLYLDNLDFVGGNVHDNAAFLASSLSGIIDIGTSVGATSFSVTATSDPIAYLQMGFLPSPVIWQHIRMDALENIGKPDTMFGGFYAGLTAEQKTLLSHLLYDNNEQAASIIVHLPWVLAGVSVAEVVFLDATGVFTLNLANSDSVDAAKESLA
jgi:2'-5' RNA ligase